MNAATLSYSDHPDFISLKKAIRRLVRSLNRSAEMPIDDINVSALFDRTNLVRIRYNGFLKALEAKGRLKGFRSYFDKMSNEERDQFFAPGLDLSNVPPDDLPWRGSIDTSSQRLAA